MGRRESYALEGLRLVSRLDTPALARRDMLISLAQPPAEDTWQGWSAWAHRRGIRLHWAYTNRDVIHTVESQALLLALLDVALPGMSGLSLVRIIRSIEPIVSCVVVSDRPTRRLMQQALDLGAFSVLPAPVGIDRFADLLGRLARAG
jgi:DNA-binding response OmpR family regulator